MKIILAVIIFLFASFDCFSQTVSVFLIKSVNNTLSLEKIDLAENEVQVFQRGGGSENISLVIPVSEGISGDFAKASDKSVMIARNKAGTLVISVQKPDGTQKELISKTSSELIKYDIKVNITGVSQKKVFNIKGYDKITEDNDSPVIDMFNGQIPMSEGDYSVTTEITAIKSEGKIEGEFGIEYYGGYYFTRLNLNGKDVDAIVDLGAANSFIIGEAVSEGTKLYDIYASEVSADGSRSIELPVSGFGGKVNNLKACDLQNISLGNIHLTEKTFYILSKIKNFEGKKIEAIIGLDILSHADNLLLEIPDENKSSKCVLRPGNNCLKGDPVPFSLSHGHIFLKGKYNNNDINFILDTGSPFNFLSESFAGENNIETREDITVYGADGNPVKTGTAKLNEFLLNNRMIKNTEFKFVSGSILSSYGLDKNGGLLGTSFLKNFTSIEVDFNNNNIYFEVK